MAKLMQQAYKDGQKYGPPQILILCSSLEFYKVTIYRTELYEISDEQENQFYFYPKDPAQSDWGYRVYIED